MGFTAPRLTAGPRLREAGRALLDLVLPPIPLDDAKEGVLTAGMSPGAWGRISFIAAPFCATCGAPFEYDMGRARSASPASPPAAHTITPAPPASTTSTAAT